jgi:large subunit ribosomal protein L10
MSFSFYGPNAVLFSNDDPVAPVKLYMSFIKTVQKTGCKDWNSGRSDYYQKESKHWLTCRLREVLLAQVLGTMQAPITSLVYVLNANIAGLARALDQIRMQKAAS